MCTPAGRSTRFTNGSKTTPTDAYAWAQGKAITGSGGPEMQLKTPLDFYMVSDHAEFMGVFNQMANPDSPLSKTELAKGVTSPDANVRHADLCRHPARHERGQARPAVERPGAGAHASGPRSSRRRTPTTCPASSPPSPASNGPRIRRSATCTASSSSATPRQLPDLVLSALDSDDPEMLWKWMDEQRAKGSTLFAIPHNGNASDGRMFELVKFDGKPIDAAYNKTRAENEPLYEITQIKGTSETHPDLSPTDEFAGFEQWDYTLSADYERPTHRKGSFARQALLDGMSQAAERRRQPVQVRLHRRHRHAQCRGQPRGVQLHRQVRVREQRQGTADRRARRAGGPDPADPGVQFGRPGRSLGAAEHARGDLGCDAAQGDLRDLGPDDQGALLRRLRLCAPTM